MRGRRVVLAGIVLGLVLTVLSPPFEPQRAAAEAQARDAWESALSTWRAGRQAHADFEETVDDSGRLLDEAMDDAERIEAGAPRGAGAP